LECAFLPNAARNWLLRLPCYYFHETNDNTAEQVSEYQQRRTTLTVIGKGITANIKAEPQVVDFGAILVNTIVEKEIVLFNPSECDLFYDLEVYMLKEIPPEPAPEGDQDKEEETHTDLVKPLPVKQYEEVLISNNVRESEIDVVQFTDILPARSNHSLKVRACVRSQTQHTFKLYYRLKAESDEKFISKVVSDETGIKSDFQGSPLVLHKMSDKLERVYLCDIRAMGVHPVVQVTDVRSDGLGKTLLWQLFSLKQFNSLLERVDSNNGGANGDSNTALRMEDELDFPTHSSSAVLTDSGENESLDFNFGAAPVGNKTTVVHLSLMNPGVVPVEWVYYFPNDLEVEIENWADPGDYTEEQLHTNLILDNALFTVTPKVRLNCCLMYAITNIFIIDGYS
jgi:hypothetical protein